jgi:uncharacterized membrane protein YheB (UPF0754 family)
VPAVIASLPLAIFDHPLWVYVALPLMGAFVGWSTKLVAREMMFKPLEFKGLVDPWLGWQGQIPRRVSKMAGIAVETVVGKLFTARDLIDRIDPDDLTKALQEPLEEAVDDIVREVVESYRPGTWDGLPQPVRNAMLSRARATAPATIKRLMADLREDADRVLDLKHIVVERLVGDKPLVNTIFRELGAGAIQLLLKAGLIFGFIIGVAQAIVFGITDNHWVLPAFGLLSGGLTDYVALQMVFRPKTPKRYLGIFRWQGLFHSTREQVSKDYAKLIAGDILTPAVVIEGVLDSPTADKLFALVAREVETVIDEQTRLARPVLRLTVGDARFRDLKQRVADLVIARLPEHAQLLDEYAQQKLDVEGLVAERMALLDTDDYEGLIRPAFKDDEKVVVLVGALLGFLVGELQVLLITSLA